jgi:hypothetical protein
MTAKKEAQCQRCGKRLRKGGDNYRIDCTIIADFDGYIDQEAEEMDPEELAEEIALSGVTEQELEEQVYFNLKQRLCADCRDEIMAFLKGFETNERF